MAEASNGSLLLQRVRHICVLILRTLALRPPILVAVVVGRGPVLAALDVNAGLTACIEHGATSGVISNCPRDANRVAKGRLFKLTFRPFRVGRRPGFWS